MSSETCKSTFQNIRNVIKPTETSSITKLLIPRQDSNNQLQEENIPENESMWDTIIDRSLIENHLLTCNCSSFRAASISPCDSGPIFKALTFSGLSKAADDIINGVIPASKTDNNPFLKEFLLSFNEPLRTPSRPDIPTALTEKI